MNVEKRQKTYSSASIDLSLATYLDIDGMYSSCFLAPLSYIDEIKFDLYDPLVLFMNRIKKNLRFSLY